ncbi:hypothetical protein YC2023_052521 [Brassica napus]
MRDDSTLFYPTLTSLEMSPKTKSVLRDGRFQSYLAMGGPSWLHDLIQTEVTIYSYLRMSGSIMSGNLQEIVESEPFGSAFVITNPQVKCFFPKIIPLSSP